MTLPLTAPLDRRLLWVTREPKVLQTVQTQLRTHQVTWHWCDAYPQALTCIAAWHPHLLVLDCADTADALTCRDFLHAELPGVDPYRPGGALYQQPGGPVHFPILLLTTDPLAPEILPPPPCNVHCLARTRTATQLLPWIEMQLPTLQPRLILDFVRQRLWVQGTILGLPARTMEILAILATHHPHPQMAAAIAHQMQEQGRWSTSENGVRAAIKALRFHLQNHALSPTLLQNHGEGYVLDLGPAYGSIQDRVWFCDNAEVWWHPQTVRPDPV